jgi:flagellar biosynthesis protein FlhA
VDLRARRPAFSSDIALAGVVLLMVAMMVIPLPAALLAILQSLNLAAALVVLLITMYTKEPLDFAVFPSLLLVTTLFRLGLNVSTTRLILLNGYAGQVVQTFGQFVVGGNPLVGFIVFLILIIIQFIVITRGAERVAEVAARFTLDAMPGKQMSIDADLNAGLIDGREARRRRGEIEREADFYGAMDGASKFVKGDAIAALLIIAINILGGFVIGMVQQGLPLATALQRYTLLTVGDGLVTQIPALLISTATGIIVTRAASQNSLGHEVAATFVAQPRVLTVAGGALAALGLVPGLPTLPFLLIAGGLVWLGRSTGQRQAAAQRAETQRQQAAAPAAGRTPEQALEMLEFDPLEIELGYGLLRLAEGPQGGEIMSRVGLIRRQIALDLGLVLPLVRVRDNIQLPPSAYVIKLRGTEVARGELRLDHFLAMDPGGTAEAVEGIPAREPAFGLPALWIPAAQKSRAEVAGYTVVDPATVLATHLSEVVKRHAHEILSRQDTKALLDAVRHRQAALVDDLVPAILSTGQVQRVLQNLLREGVPIRNLTSILETLAEHGPAVKDTEVLTERVRAALAREITRDLPVEGNRLQVITLDPSLEARLGEGAPLDAEALRVLRQSLAEGVTRATTLGRQPVVLTTPPARPAFRRLVERLWPSLRVVSPAEIAGDLEIESVGVVRA